MPVLSKQVTDRTKSSETVAAATDANASIIQKGLEPMVGAEAARAAVVFLSALGAHLRTQTNAMKQADDANAAELADDARFRDNRDTASANLSAVIVKSKDQLLAVAGPAYLKSIRADGVTPANDPAQLERFATNMLEGLTSQPAPASLLPGYTVVPESFAAPIRAPLEALRAALKDVKREVEEAQVSLADRDAKIVSNDKAFAGTANVLTAVLNLIGQRDLAKKVRPSERQSGVTAEDAGEPLSSLPG